jgi:hypothetical protein
MALPTAYLTSSKNLESILDALKSAQAPDKFTTRFLESLEFKSASDRLIIGVLKSIGFLDDGGKPIERYFRFLDQTQSATVLAEGIEESFQDLFRVNVNANKMTKQEVMSKFKTLSQGQLSESVNDKLAMTFVALCSLADFDNLRRTTKLGVGTQPPAKEDIKVDTEMENQPSAQKNQGIAFGGLHYNIQLILPESRDPKVYDALFKSLKEHLA